MRHRIVFLKKCTIIGIFAISNNHVMQNFQYYAPTQVVFGRDTENQVAELVKKYGGSRVLLHYGGQSAVKSGLIAIWESLTL